LTESVLDIRNLSVSFGGIRAVDHLSFTVSRNSVTALIGPNGAGKTTVFNLIDGSVRADTGTIAIEGKEFVRPRPGRLRAMGIGRSFQITSLFSGLTVAENLRLASQPLEQGRHWLTPLGWSAKTRIRVEELLAQFQLCGKAGHDVDALSHGEQRCLEIAVALAARPKLLMLDEPTQGMSRPDRAAMADLIQALAQTVTIVLIEHDLELVANVCDHVVVMDRGRKLSEGSANAVRADPQVKAVYVGRGDP